MKFKLSLILSISISALLKSQYIIYPYYYHNNLQFEYQIHLDSLSHNSIRPYMLKLNAKQPWNIPITKLNDSSNILTVFFPVVCTTINTNKEANTYFSFFSAFIPNKHLSIQLIPEFSYFANNDKLNQHFDSIGLIPSLGIPDYKKNNTFLKFSFRNNIHWQTFPFLWFDAGYGKHFIGDGYRSLFLSDNASSFPYIKGTAKKWNVQYIVLYSFFYEPKWNNFNNSYTRKNSTLHYLSWNIKNRLTIHGFETVIWQVHDSIGNRHFDINYVNPIIFFRPVEFSLGSPDNVLMGAGFRWQLYKQNYFYLQFLLDEFKLSEWKKKKHWWGNKYALQAGFKSFLPWSQNRLLFLRTEFNMVRPFTYAHDSYLRAWGHMHQPLAHPMGANFIEWLGHFSLVNHRWMYVLYTQYARQGHDSYNFNTGNNIYRSYNDHRQDYGNYLLVGKNIYSLTFSAAVYKTIKTSWELQLFSKADYAITINEAERPKKQWFFYVGLTTRGFMFIL